MPSARLPLLLAFLALVSSRASAPQAPPRWHQIGTTRIDVGLPDPATGPVSRVWFDSNGALYALLPSGRAYFTVDFQDWTPAPPTVAPPPPPPPPPATPPDPQARVFQASRSRFYALGSALYRSDDKGQHWTNLTTYHDWSILGTPLLDLAVDPTDPDHLIVATAFGLWRSLDGGLSWSGCNDNLPALPIQELLALPDHGNLPRISLASLGEAIWAPGPSQAWRLVSPTITAERQQLLSQISRQLGAPVTRAQQAGRYLYAASISGTLWSSADSGQHWYSFPIPGGGSVADLFADPSYPTVALAVTNQNGRGSVLRTTNAGIFWEDISADLPPTPIYGITADLISGAVYVATRDGVFMSIQNLRAPAPAASWNRVAGLPPAPVVDVALDASANRLFVAVDGYGVFSALAPHRSAVPVLVSAADLRARPLAPGALLSFLGPPLDLVTINSTPLPILSTRETETQFQLPFDLQGSTVSLQLVPSPPGSQDRQPRELRLTLPLVDSAPAILVYPDGSPFLLDPDTGILLDPTQPLPAGARLQLLATGLGRVTPDWPPGTPAPILQPPRVIHPVKVYLNAEPLLVFGATLAPGYVGLYAIEIQLPRTVNAGPAQLTLEVAGHPSNPVILVLDSQ